MGKLVKYRVHTAYVYSQPLSFVTNDFEFRNSEYVCLISKNLIRDKWSTTVYPKQFVTAGFNLPKRPKLRKFQSKHKFEIFYYFVVVKFAFKIFESVYWFYYPKKHRSYRVVHSNLPIHSSMHTNTMNG